MKSVEPEFKNKKGVVAPARERGLKYIYAHEHKIQKSRSREGAWIEIYHSYATSIKYAVAPVRERGLKSIIPVMPGRSRAVAPTRERGLKH